MYAGSFLRAALIHWDLVRTHHPATPWLSSRRPANGRALLCDGVQAPLAMRKEVIAGNIGREPEQVGIVYVSMRKELGT